VYFPSLATSDDLIEFAVAFDSAIRWYVCMYALFHRQTDVGLQETEGGFRTHVYTATDPADVDYAAVRAELNRDVERFTNVGSGWTLTAILRFVIRIGQYRPLAGSSFIPTPASLVAKHAVINVDNPDDSMCFVWAVLSALYPCKKNAERVSKYRPHLNSIDLTGLNCPIPINRIARFEKNNPTISINVYALGKDDREIIPKFVTKCGAREKHVVCYSFPQKRETIFITRGLKI
jgi:TusA-related sulfurtransferase